MTQRESQEESEKNPANPSENESAVGFMGDGCLAVLGEIIPVHKSVKNLGEFSAREILGSGMDVLQFWGEIIPVHKSVKTLGEFSAREILGSGMDVLRFWGEIIPTRS